MFCRKCGKKLNDDDRFCAACGEMVEKSEKSEITKIVETQSENKKDNKSLEYEIQKGLYGKYQKDFKEDWSFDVKAEYVKKCKRVKRFLIIVIVVACIFILVLASSFNLPPSHGKVIKNDNGVKITYDYYYDDISGGGHITKEYKGTDKEGNVVDVIVTYYPSDEDNAFTGKINKTAVADEDGYGEITVFGTINGFDVTTEYDSIDANVLAKYSDMIEEVNGCDLYIKFKDNGKTFTSVNQWFVKVFVVLVLTSLTFFGLYIVCLLNKKKFLEINK